MTSPIRRRLPPHRTISAPVSSADLTRKLLATTPPSGPFLLTYPSLPSYARQNANAYIRTSYRPCPTHSLAKCLQSLLYMHNESVNIHSHLLGSFLFAFMGVFWWGFEFQGGGGGGGGEGGGRVGGGWGDVVVLGVFFGSVVGCLGMSAVYHCVSCHSEVVEGWAQRGDHVGIVVLIWGSFVPSLWYGFSCEKGLRGVYWGMITLLALICTTLCLHPRFRTPTYRPIRATTFVLMGLSAIVPVLHGLKLYGLASMNDRIGLPWLVLQGVLYILGAGVYVARVPERWYPQRFDVWGASHQVFHVMVLTAAGCHLVGLLRAYEYRKMELVC